MIWFKKISILEEEIKRKQEIFLLKKIKSNETLKNIFDKNVMLASEIEVEKRNY